MTLSMMAADRAAELETRPKNGLLRLLRIDDYRLIAPHLKDELKLVNSLLYSPGDNVDRVYFPCGPSLVSYLVTNEDGRNTETALVGREGAVGGIVSSGHLPAYCRILVKYPGPFVHLPVSILEEAKAKSASLKSFIARYADCLLAQIFQSASCNAIHSIEQRAAKWIIAAVERTGDHVVPMTQDELAGLLGVGRSYVSRIIFNLRTEGALDSKRGALIIRDFDTLKRKSCNCNESVKSHFDEVLAGLYPAEVPH